MTTVNWQENQLVQVIADHRKGHILYNSDNNRVVVVFPDGTEEIFYNAQKELTPLQNLGSMHYTLYHQLKRNRNVILHKGNE